MKLLRRQTPSKAYGKIFLGVTLKNYQLFSLKLKKLPIVKHENYQLVTMCSSSPQYRVNYVFLSLCSDEY